MYITYMHIICIADETIEARDFVFLEGCLTVFDYCRYLIPNSVPKTQKLNAV